MNQIKAPPPPGHISTSHELRAYCMELASHFSKLSLRKFLIGLYQTTKESSIETPSYSDLGRIILDACGQQFPDPKFTHEVQLYQNAINSPAYFEEIQTKDFLLRFLRNQIWELAHLKPKAYRQQTYLESQTMTRWQNGIFRYFLEAGTRFLEIYDPDEIEYKQGSWQILQEILSDGQSQE